MLDTILVLGAVSFIMGFIVCMFREDWIWRLLGVMTEFLGLALLWIVYQYGFSIAQGEEYVMGFTAAALIVFFLALFITQWLIWLFRVIEKF